MDSQTVASVGSCPQVVVRPMTDSDLDTATELHVMAFQGYMNVRLGRGYVRAMLRWFREHPSGIAIVACLDEQVVGYTVGAPVGYDRELNQALWRRALASLAMRPTLLLHRDILARIRLRMRALLGTGAPASAPAELADWMGADIHSLVGIGVAPAAQGQRIGSQLIARFEVQARRLRARGVRLSVYETNLQAHRAYERAGWRPILCPGLNYRYYVKSL
ncbi:MAG: GNAT family N-acetyltransferase [Pirellulales bacterium]|nr:GNAT family N-acetyltransferase [Pirellulales bacterium]